jgi:phenylacetic acid degradation operon negative regulatory protein
MTVVSETTAQNPTSPDGIGPAAATAGASAVVSAPGSDGGLPTRLMVLGLTHRDGTVHGTELYRVAEECDISVESVRSCMRRLVGEGLFERDGEGRDARFHATADGLAALEVNQQRHLLAYAQDAAGRGWDRHWRLVAFAIPEAQRAARDRYRDHLIALGGAQLQPGLYVSPHRWEEEVGAGAERLGIAEFVTLLSSDDLSVGGDTNPRSIAARLWGLEEVAAAYRRFIESYAAVPARLEEMRARGERLSEHDFLPGALHIAIRFNACFEADPLLPPELLPKPWPGRQARELLARCRRLGVLAREDKSGPALFRVFDEAIADLL